MTATHDTRTPFWQVTAVFDPDGQGGDFAYTVGLADRGFPELHLWARPSLGDDPGEDWKFSSRDLGGILNECAWRLIDGGLRVGDTWTHEYDAGFVRVHFQFDAPQDADSLEAYEAPDSPVAPIRWSLDRPPLGPLVPMREEARAEADADLAWARDAADRIGAGEDLIPEADWSVTGFFGPRTAIVEAYADLVQALGGEHLDALIFQLADLRVAGALSYPLVAARSAARPSGRVEHVQRAEEWATVIARRFGETWGLGSVQEILTKFGAVDASDRVEILENLRHVLSEGLATFFATAVVADQVDAESRLAGLGPVMGAFSARGAAPTPDWWASQQVRDRLSEVIDQGNPQGLVRAAVSWYEATFDSLDGWGSILRARAMSSAAMAPDLTTLLSADQMVSLRVLCLTNQIPWSFLQDWARDFCAILTFGDEIPDHVRQVFVDASERWMPLRWG